jgi:hypothetical protein
MSLPVGPLAIETEFGEDVIENEALRTRWEGSGFTALAEEVRCRKSHCYILKASALAQLLCRMPQPTPPVVIPRRTRASVTGTYNNVRALLAELELEMEKIRTRRPFWY